MTGLYFVKDRLSDLRITNFLEFPKNIVAAKSFGKFLEDKSEDDKPFFQLWKVADVYEDDTLKDCLELVTTGKDYKEDMEVFLANYKEDINELL